MKKVAVGVVLSSLSLTSIAGAKLLTAHSRANCGNNESISWELGQSHMLKTISHHSKYINGKLKHSHDVVNDWKQTWRSASVCWGEGVGQGYWKVQGYHFRQIQGKPTLWKKTNAVDCSIYNGWWDY